MTFTPDADFNGVATFSYTVTDGSLVSNTATVTVNVAPVNDAPVANDDSLAATEDTPVTFSAADLLTTATWTATA
ncbi:cadherin-like domain-containing protein [Pseudomonas stutzeri]|nr:cadherin-like domain-containing protein [Stutzerimonas stutzeri]